MTELNVFFGKNATDDIEDLNKQDTERHNIEKFKEWFLDNLIYCENTHSFVHRLMMEFDIKQSKAEVQMKANDIVFDMLKVFKGGKETTLKRK